MPKKQNISSNKVDYKIIGAEIQVLEVLLNPQEGIVAEAGSLLMMDNGIQMQTIFGDGRDEKIGLLAKFAGSGKRLLSGENMYMTLFYNGSSIQKEVSFAASYPGKIIPLQLASYDGELFCQKDSFLCATKGVAISNSLRENTYSHGEGIIMHQVNGEGLVFMHAGGSVQYKELMRGEKLLTDVRCVVAMTNFIKSDIEYMSGVRTALFGGDGLYLASLEGPGKVWIQSLPFNRWVNRMLSAVPTRKEEKGILSNIRSFFD